jgi:hypothetical protein
MQYYNSGPDDFASREEKLRLRKLAQQQVKHKTTCDKNRKKRKAKKKK